MRAVHRSLDDSRPDGVVVARDPIASRARPCRRAADLRLLLDDDDIETQMGRRDGSGKTGCPGADDDEIARGAIARHVGPSPNACRIAR